MSRMQKEAAPIQSVGVHFIAALALLALAASAPGAASAAAADEAWGAERGFALGLQLQTDVIGAEDPGPNAAPDQLFIEETGHGATVHVGYTFTPAFALRWSLGVAGHGTSRDAVEAYHSSSMLEAHWRFLPHERARPYLFGGLGGAVIETDAELYDSEIRGGAAVLGLGLLYNLTRHLLLDAQGRLDFINWNEAQLQLELPQGGTLELAAPVEDDGGALKFQVGVAWQF